MKVWIVESIEAPSQNLIEGVFLSKEAAMKYAKKESGQTGQCSEHERGIYRGEYADYLVFAEEVHS